MPKITIQEFHEADGYTDEIKVSGTIDEIEAKDYVEDWCDANNCLFSEINFFDGYFIARVSADDYK